MGNYVALELINKIKKKKIKIQKSKILIMGLTFKENTNDTRDSKVFDIIKTLKKNKKINIFAFDPNLQNRDLDQKLNIKLNKRCGKLDILVLAVPHKEFLKFNFKKISQLLNHKVY